MGGSRPGYVGLQPFQGGISRASLKPCTCLRNPTHKHPQPAAAQPLRAPLPLPAGAHLPPVQDHKRLPLHPLIKQPTLSHYWLFKVKNLPKPGKQRLFSNQERQTKNQERQLIVSGRAEHSSPPQLDQCGRPGQPVVHRRQRNSTRAADDPWAGHAGSLWGAVIWCT